MLLTDYTMKLPLIINKHDYINDYRGRPRVQWKTIVTAFLSQ